MKVYADNAATTKISEAALEKFNSISLDTFGNPSSLYSTGQDAKKVLEDSRLEIAEVIGASPKEIFFSSGGSESDNWAIRSAAKIGKKNGKNHIISTTIEHHAVLHTLQKLEEEGFEITLLEVDENGLISLDDLKDPEFKKKLDQMQDELLENAGETYTDDDLRYDTKIERMQNRHYGYGMNDRDDDMGLDEVADDDETMRISM